MIIKVITKKIDTPRLSQKDTDLNFGQYIVGPIIASKVCHPGHSVLEHLKHKFLFKFDITNLSLF